MDQRPLFDDDVVADPKRGARDLRIAAAALPPGLVYQPGFLDADEEAALIDFVRQLPLAEATYKQWTARRRVASFGGRFDYVANRLHDAPPIPPALHRLRDRVAAWGGLAAERRARPVLGHQRVGPPLGWHRDVPDFDEVYGVSLGSDATLRLRPYPQPGAARGDHGTRREVVTLALQARSIYRLRGPARWAWQHAVPPVPALRWSITFRTRRNTDRG